MLTGVQKGVSNSRMRRDEKEDEEGDWNMVARATSVGFSRGGRKIEGYLIFLIEVGLLSRLKEKTGN